MNDLDGGNYEDEAHQALGILRKPQADNGEAAAKPVTWFDDAGWNETDIPTRPWLAPGYLLRGAITLLIGPGGVSKSALVISYAVALALGTSLHGMKPTAAARSLIFNAEDNAEEQRRRLSAALTSMNRVPADIAGMIGRLGPVKVGLLLDRHPETGALRRTAGWYELELRIKRFKPDVLFLDPLAELHMEDENGNVALREVVAEFRSLAVEHDIAVVLVHHTRKGPAAPGDMDSGRGASSIASAARIVLTITAMQDGDAGTFGLSPDARKQYFRLDGGKSNYHRLTDTEWFERHPYMLANGDQVAVPLPWTPPVDAINLDTRLAIHAAVAAGTPSGPWSAKLSSDPRSIRHLFLKHGIRTAPGERAAIEDLRRSGFVVADFKKPNRGTAKGLRASDGRPTMAEWLDDDAA